jgi:SAM-dependent methyltransferase
VLFRLDAQNTWGYRQRRVYVYKTNPSAALRSLGQDVVAASAVAPVEVGLASREGFQPQRYTALDLNPAGIRFCKQRHQVAGLVFIQGDAENLPFAPNTFDGVVNVEASHCYPDFPQFLAQVSRVLRPGGHFLYADFRFGDRLSQWEQALVAAPLQMLRRQNISAEVLRGMNQNSSRSLDLVERRLPRFLHSLGRDFAGTKGSRIYKDLHSGALSYRSYRFEKPV